MQLVVSVKFIRLWHILLCRLKRLKPYSDMEIMTRFAQYERESNLLKSVNIQLSALIDKAKLPERGACGLRGCS